MFRIQWRYCTIFCVQCIPEFLVKSVLRDFYGRKAQQVSFVTHENKRRVSPEVRLRRLPWTILTATSLFSNAPAFFVSRTPLRCAVSVALVSGSSRWRWFEMRNRPLLRKRKHASTLIIRCSEIRSDDFLSGNPGKRQTGWLSW